MRFLRMLTNALLAGALGAAYLTVLVLQLNPHVPLLSSTVWWWYITLGALYGVHLAVLFYVAMVLREFVTLDMFSPGWVSVRLLAWLSSITAAVAALLMWLNVRGLPAVLDEAANRRFAVGAGATTASAVVLLGIAIAHYSFGRRGSRVGATLLMIAITGSLALPLAARGRGGEPPAPPIRETMSAATPNTSVPHVVLLMLDGASLEFVWPRAAEGRLPNFGRLLDSGASLDLATIRPTQPDPVWAAVATGMYPAKNGVRSATSYYAGPDSSAIDLLPDHCVSQALVRLGLVRNEPKSSSAWQASPIWSILGDYGISSGIVRWPLTYPAQPTRGFLVTDRFHSVLGTMFEIDGGATYPANVQPIVHTAFAESEAAGADLLPAGVPLATSPVRDIAPGRWDRSYSRALRDLNAQRPVSFTAIRYQGVDAIGHHYLRYAQPRAFGDVSDEERLKYGAVLERYYAYIDGQIGVALDHLAPGDLLLVVSGFGMELVGPIKHLLGRVIRDPDLSGTHERAPDGFLLAYGEAVAAGRYQRGSIVDVAPTILYFLGLPVGRDMDGYARADIFNRAFTAERPITFIPSHRR